MLFRRPSENIRVTRGKVGECENDGWTTSWSSRPICMTWAVSSKICAFCDLIQETPTTEQFAHIHDAHVAECMESCAGFSRDRSRRVVLGFTNPRPSLKNRALGNSRSSFANQLQQICDRMQEIKRVLIRGLARSEACERRVGKVILPFILLRLIAGAGRNRLPDLSTGSASS